MYYILKKTEILNAYVLHKYIFMSFFLTINRDLDWSPD